MCVLYGVIVYVIVIVIVYVCYMLESMLQLYI